MTYKKLPSAKTEGELEKDIKGPTTRLNIRSKKIPCPVCKIILMSLNGRKFVNIHKVPGAKNTVLPITDYKYCMYCNKMYKMKFLATELYPPNLIRFD